MEGICFSCGQKCDTFRCDILPNFSFSVFVFFQDLQGEIDTERDNFLSLAATSRKLLSSLQQQQQQQSSSSSSEDDSAALQKRLEEMNQRWNYLKAKSVAIRYDDVIV